MATEPVIQEMGSFFQGERPEQILHDFDQADGEPIPFTTGTWEAVGVWREVNAAEADLQTDEDGASINDAAEGRALWQMPNDAFATPGDFYAQIWVGNGTNRYASDLFHYEIRAGIGPAPDI